MAETRFQHPPDPPWIFRTYAGHSTPAKSNELYRANLAKGQTGLSIAFDLPTQTGYDSDHPLARGEVGKVGVPIGHLGDMRVLFEGIPLARMNTSSIADGVSTLHFHYMVGTPAEITYFTEDHELGLFTDADYRAALAGAGLETYFDAYGLDGRGMYIGIKPQ